MPGPYLRGFYGTKPSPKMVSYKFFSRNLACLYIQYIKKTLPPETFPGLEISLKCVCGLGSAWTRPGELTAFPRPSSWIRIKGEEGKGREREGRGKGGKRGGKRGERGREGREGRKEPQCLATALVYAQPPRSNRQHLKFCLLCTL